MATATNTTINVQQCAMGLQVALRTLTPSSGNLTIDAGLSTAETIAYLSGPPYAVVLLVPLRYAHPIGAAVLLGV